MIPGALDRKGETLSIEVRRVLVVDEALPIRRKMVESLARTGLPPELVRQATSAEEALELFALDPPDLVFTELVGEDPAAGLAMVAEMLSIDAHTRIVLVTSEAPDSPVVRRAVRLGAFAVVEKPLRHEKIRALLAEIEDEESGIQRFR